jgi:hypothetical protein
MLSPGIARHQVEFAALEKIKLKLWLKAQWCIPPKQSGGRLADGGRARRVLPWRFTTADARVKIQAPLPAKTNVTFYYCPVRHHLTGDGASGIARWTLTRRGATLVAGVSALGERRSPTNYSAR